MALITLPTKFGFSRVEHFQLTRLTNLLRSRFTGQAQKVLYPFALWEFQGQLIEYDGIEAAEIRGFLAALEGRKNTFEFPVPGYAGFSTGFLGEIYVNATAEAKAVSFSVHSNSVSIAVIKKGDFFTINNELKIATADFNSDAAGDGVVSFQPPLRKQILVTADLATVRRLHHSKNGVGGKAAYCVMHANTDEVASWSISPPIRHGIKFAAIEDLSI